MDIKLMTQWMAGQKKKINVSEQVVPAAPSLGGMSPAGFNASTNLIKTVSDIINKPRPATPNPLGSTSQPGRLPPQPMDQAVTDFRRTQITSTPNSGLPVPTGIQQTDWNKLDPKRQQEYMDNEKKVQDRMAANRAAGDYKPGGVVTPQNTSDYLNAVDRWGAEARATGQDIGVVRNQEIGRQIEADRAAQTAAANEKSIADAKGRLAATTALGAKAGIQGNSIEIVGKTMEMERSMRNAGIDPSTATPEQLAAHRDAWSKNRQEQKARDQASTTAWQQGKLKTLTGDKTNEQGERLITVGDETFNLDQLQGQAYDANVRRAHMLITGELQRRADQAKRQADQEARARRRAEASGNIGNKRA